MTRTDLQIRFHRETGLQVLQTGIEMNMYFTDDYIAWLENLVLDKANGAEKSASTCNLQNVNARISHFIDENGNSVDANAAGVNVGLTRHGTVIFWLGMGFAGEQKTLTPIYVR